MQHRKHSYRYLSQLGSFKEESSLNTWIYRIATHKALDKIRRRKTRQKLHKLLPWWMPGRKKEQRSSFHHPGILAENKEKAAVLFKAIESLPEKTTGWPLH